MKIAYALPDKAQYFTLFESTGWNEGYQLSAERLYEAIRHSWFSVCAYEADRLVGFGRVILDGVLHALIVDLIVRPDDQGHGIGGRILNELVARCQSHGVRDVQLFCAKGKVNFYAQHGFVDRPSDAPGMELRTHGSSTDQEGLKLRHPANPRRLR